MLAMTKINMSRVGTIALAAVCAVGVFSCKKGGRGKSPAARWIDNPTPAEKKGKVIAFQDLGVKFEIPDTLYVYKSCAEASHTPEGENKWIPIITCQSIGDPTTSAFEGGGGGEEGEEADFSDFSAESDEEEFSSGAETLALTFYITRKTRPIDERAVSWFENQYKQAGLQVDDVSYQHDYQKKAGIYSKLQVMNTATSLPTREIIQFMFPRKDVVFIARIEYPFGETRSVMTDWKYLLWNFDIDAFQE